MFDFLPKPFSSTIAIADTSVYPSSLQDFHHKYFVSTCFAPLSFFTQYKNTLPTSIPALGSVGLMALYIAYMISFKRIFLMGMDFSYYVGKTHANNSASHTKWLLDHAKTEQFSSIGKQLENPTLKKIDKDTHRVSDAVLQRYANDFDELIQYIEKEKNIKVFDLNAPYSLLKNATKIRLEHFQHHVHGNVANKHKEKRLNPFRSHAKQSLKFQESKKIVIQEQKKYKKLLERISILEREKILPNEEDWQTLGLDTCTYPLFFNTYFLRTSYRYWQENAISTHIKIMIHRALQDLEKIISQTTISTDIV